MSNHKFPENDLKKTSLNKFEKPNTRQTTLPEYSNSVKKPAPQKQEKNLSYLNNAYPELDDENSHFLDRKIKKISKNEGNNENSIKKNTNSKTNDLTISVNKRRMEELEIVEFHQNKIQKLMNENEKDISKLIVSPGIKKKIKFNKNLLFKVTNFKMGKKQKNLLKFKQVCKSKAKS